MAVELKKFQAELKPIEAAVASAYGEWKMVGDSQGNFKKLLDGTRLGIGDRVQKLKEGGAQGTTLDDFATDPVVKQALANVKTALANYKQLEARKIATLEQFKKVHKDLTGLADRMDAEVADRKKKLFEPKSLPEMSKLAKSVRGMVDEVGGLKSQSIGDIVKTRVKPGEFEKTFWEDLDREIKKSAAVRANAAVSELLEKFKPRLMKLRSDRVGSLAQETLGLCVKATTAHKGGQADAAKSSLKAALVNVDEIHRIVGDYNEAYTKNKSFLKDNPDHDVILKFVGGLTTKENQVLKAVQATQAALK